MIRSILFFGLMTLVLAGHQRVSSWNPFTKNKSHVYPLCIVQASGRANMEVPEVKCVVMYENKNSITKSFLRSRIVPDIINKAPTKIADVTFSSGVKALIGNVLTPTLVRYKPQITWSVEKGALYTLLMTDADGPPKPDGSTGEVRHWWVVNIPENNINQGQTVHEYIGSAPDPGSYHRYVFLIFKQSERINTKEYVADNTSTSQEGRLTSTTRDLIQRYNLGNPVYGNFYQAAYDPTANIIRDQIGIPIMNQ
ncbi:PEBP1.2 family protein [Megaselia abdita]